jgi:hypothetical protein
MLSTWVLNASPKIVVADVTLEILSRDSLVDILRGSALRRSAADARAPGGTLRADRAPTYDAEAL